MGIHTSDLIRAFGDDAIEIQKQWNAAHEKEVLRFKRVLQSFPPHIGKSLMGLHPKRQVLDAISLEHRVRVSMTREITAQVKLTPLNLSYDTLFGSTAKNESRIKIAMEQLPIDHVRNNTPT